jgi:RNA polymerase sigma-70 factor, ECF subfamily
MKGTSAERFELERDLVIRAQQGDPNALNSIFMEFKARIYSICLRMTKNTSESEDLTQEAFLQAFRKLYTFRRDCALSSWLYRITVNTVLMHFRRRVPRQVAFEESGIPDNTFEYGTKDPYLSGCVDRIALIRAIGELPSGYRRIFLLHEVQGYGHEEIAKLLDCSMGNSKSQLHKAKVRMRELMGETGRRDRVKTKTGERSRSRLKDTLIAKCRAITTVGEVLLR